MFEVTEDSEHFIVFNICLILYFPSKHIIKRKSFNQYKNFFSHFLCDLSIRSNYIHIFLTLICSSGHVKRSFDNPAKNFSIRVRKNFAGNPENNYKTSNLLAKFYSLKASSRNVKDNFDSPAQKISLKL